MGKLTIQEIAAVLQQKNSFDKQEANTFVTTMFQIIQERLETDGIVKVKGFGTFKLVDVEARESVSVRTGERGCGLSHGREPPPVRVCGRDRARTLPGPDV